jgi:hypothetical protein
MGATPGGAQVTWIKVEHPTLDIVHLVLDALGLAGFCCGCALALGIIVGISFIFWRRRHPVAEARVVLDLDLPATQRG